MARSCQLYRHFDCDGSLLYVGISYSAYARAVSHRSTSGWADKIVRIEIEHFPDRKDAEDAEIKAIRIEKPLHNLANIPIDEMNEQDAIDRGLSIKRFKIVKAAAERRNQPEQTIDWAAAKRRLDEARGLRNRKYA